jgi:uncharacterized cupredoxin-like copper-binding protein
MRKATLAALGALTAIAALTMAGSASAAAVVHVELWDKMNGAMATNLAYGMPGADPAKAAMGIKAEPASVPAGVVSFKVTNTSKDFVHEMVVLRLAEPGKPLPYDAGQMKVEEQKAGYKGEVDDLDPGKSGTVTLALQPGHYLLICNQPGHFAAGMWTPFDVSK